MGRRARGDLDGAGARQTSAQKSRVSRAAAHSTRLGGRQRRPAGCDEARRALQDEWLRYVSLKWCAGYTCILVVGGLWTFCSGASGVSAVVYFGCVLLFLLLFAFMLLWFDIQYDMSTIF